MYLSDIRKLVIATTIYFYNFHFIGFEVLTAVTLNSTVFWLWSRVVWKGPDVSEEPLGFFLSLLFDPECGDDLFLFPNYMALQPKDRTLSICFFLPLLFSQVVSLSRFHSHISQCRLIFCFLKALLRATHHPKISGVETKILGMWRRTVWQRGTDVSGSTCHLHLQRIRYQNIGGCKFLVYVGTCLTDYTASHPERSLYYYLSLWEPQISKRKL
jgi:hypothetical protein